MKRILILVVLVALLGGGYAVWRHTHQPPSTVETSIVTVQRRDLERTIETTGEVSPLNRVEIRPPISGRIESIQHEEGDTVKAGDILAWMSSSDRAAILDAARAKGPDEVKKWEDAYKPTPVISPLNGTLILRNIVVGQTVDPTTVLFAMSDHLIVLAQVDESDIGQVTIGMPARVTLDAYPNDDVDGTVSQIEYEGKNVSNVITYGVKINMKHVPPFFRSQMTANVVLISERRPDVLVVPAAAVVNNKSVFVPGAKEPEERAVTVGLRSGGLVEITSGLNEGDQVVVRRARYVPRKADNGSPLSMSRPRSGGNQQRGK